MKPGRFTLDPKYCKKYFHYNKFLKILTTARKTFLQIILVNHFEDTNKLGDKMDTIGLQDL
jgi:hypothetical protein